MRIGSVQFSLKLELILISLFPMCVCVSFWIDDSYFIYSFIFILVFVIRTRTKPKRNGIWWRISIIHVSARCPLCQLVPTNVAEFIVHSLYLYMSFNRYRVRCEEHISHLTYLLKTIGYINRFSFQLELDKAIRRVCGRPNIVYIFSNSIFNKSRCKWFV